MGNKHLIFSKTHATKHTSFFPVHYGESASLQFFNYEKQNRRVDSFATTLKTHTTITAEQKYILYLKLPGCCRNPNKWHQHPIVQHCVPGTILTTLQLSFRRCNNHSWVRLLSPFATKEMDMIEWEQGPCLPVPGWNPSPHQGLARGRLSIPTCSNRECKVGPLLAQRWGAPFTLCSVSGRCEWAPLCHGSLNDCGQNWPTYPRIHLNARSCHLHFSKALRGKVVKPGFEPRRLNRA